MLPPVKLPPSFAPGGFLTASSLRGQKKRRLLLGCEGFPDSGKSEFALSAPGPGAALILDRGIDPVFDNKNPPPTRQPNWGFKVVQAPLETQATQDDFKAYWAKFRDDCKAVCLNPDIRSVLIDGDSDSWELQRLATFGRLSKIPSIMYVEANAVRRALYARFWDSGKIVIATNKLRKLYEDKWNPDGSPVMGSDGKQVREWKGAYERQGFDDQEYLWQIQLRNLYDEKRGQWGIRILKCKADRSLVGMELWGEECNFQSLVQAVYPQVPMEEWGY